MNVNAFRKTRLRIQKTQAGLEGEGGKLVFTELMLSLRASALKWRGNPPVERNQVSITTKNRRSSHHFGVIFGTFSL